MNDTTEVGSIIIVIVSILTPLSALGRAVLLPYRGGPFFDYDIT